MARVLIVDDEPSLCRVLALAVSQMGHDVYTCHTLREGLALGRRIQPEIILLDVFLPDGNGLKHVSLFRGLFSQPEVIIITGKGEPYGARMAMEAGAWDYLPKPISTTDVELQIQRALQYRESKGKGPRLVALRVPGIKGECPQIQRALDLVAQASVSDADVLIVGETGTGKELFAKAIHENSSRRQGNFVVVDCASIPEQLVQSVLFGHKKGAFTGAEKDQQGLVAQAHGGTLFLDEVGELPITVQKTFLRVLQERRFRPIGAKEEVESAFRLIAATNRDLDRMVQEGRFREDLLYRLKAITIALPPLRERKGDVVPLVLHHVLKLCEKYGIEPKGFSPELVEAFERYPWPGNVRELVQALNFMITRAWKDPVLFPVHLPPHIRAHLAVSSFEPVPEREFESMTTQSWPDPLPPIKEARYFAEREYLKELLRRCGKDINKACEMAGISKSHLYELLKRHSMSLK